MSNNDNLNEDEIDLNELLNVIWDGKKLIILLTFITSIAGALLALYTPNVYKSDAILASASNSSSLSSMASQYSGLASMAGISIPSSGNVDETALGIEVLRSFSFFENFVSKYDLLIPLIAGKSWNEESNTLIFDDELYDSSSKKWISKLEFSRDGIPSLQYSHRKFLEKLSISKNIKTNFVTLSFEHYSPLFAKKIVELLIVEINEHKRIDDILQAERSILYLEKEIEGTQLAEVRIGLSALIQKQKETVMLANATPEYLFKTASPPIASELQISPNRPFICIMAFLSGFILSILLVLSNQFIFQPRSTEK